MVGARSSGSFDPLQISGQKKKKKKANPALKESARNNFAAYATMTPNFFFCFRITGAGLDCAFLLICF